MGTQDPRTAGPKTPGLEIEEPGPWDPGPQDSGPVIPGPVNQDPGAWTQDFKIHNPGYKTWYPWSDYEYYEY